MFKVLLEHQLAAMVNETDKKISRAIHGLAVDQLYTRCTQAMIVSHTLGFRTLLTEFYDHQIIRSQKDITARFGASSFTIRHYALEVTYQSEGFIEKNKDTISEDLLNVINSTTNSFVKEILVSSLGLQEKNSQELQNNSVKVTNVLSKKSTLGSIFKSSLIDLMETINSTNVHYIRCIKPNDEKVSWKFEPKLVLSQLRACGVLETIRISSQYSVADYEHPISSEILKVIANKVMEDQHSNTLFLETVSLDESETQAPIKQKFSKRLVEAKRGSQSFADVINGLSGEPCPTYPLFPALKKPVIDETLELPDPCLDSNTFTFQLSQSHTHQEIIEDLKPSILPSEKKSCNDNEKNNTDNKLLDKENSNNTLDLKNEQHSEFLLHHKQNLPNVSNLQYKSLEISQNAPSSTLEIINNHSDSLDSDSQIKNSFLNKHPFYDSSDNINDQKVFSIQNIPEKKDVKKVSKQQFLDILNWFFCKMINYQIRTIITSIKNKIEYSKENRNRIIKEFSVEITESLIIEVIFEIVFECVAEDINKKNIFKKIFEIMRQRYRVKIFQKRKMEQIKAEQEQKSFQYYTALKKINIINTKNRNKEREIYRFIDRETDENMAETLKKTHHHINKLWKNEKLNNILISKLKHNSEVSFNFWELLIFSADYKTSTSFWLRQKFELKANLKEFSWELTTDHGLNIRIFPPTPQNTPSANTFPSISGLKISSTFSTPMVSPMKEHKHLSTEGTLSQNSGLTSSIHGKSCSFPSSSEYIESLPQGIRYRILGLQGLQHQHAKLEVSFQDEILLLEKKYSNLYKPLYTRRAEIITGASEPTAEEIEKGREFGQVYDTENRVSEIKNLKSMLSGDVKGIPQFWLTAMKNISSLAEIITPEDEKALSYLTDIRMCYLDKPGFRLEFYFSDNEFFSNKVITKTYFYRDELGYGGDFIYDHAEGDKIEWKANKDLTTKVEVKKQRNKNTKQTRVIKKTVPKNSFFNFFLPPVVLDEQDDNSDIDNLLEADYQYGEDIKEKVFLLCGR
ncbi:hypothetical protein PCK2_000244 [Pneumocystis canis]|nr:hypothetical protein PCK2_000244 [Pneumocystis canis]